MNNVVQTRPGGKSFSALDLEKARLADVHASLDKLDPQDRAEFRHVLKTLKVMGERIPHIEEHVGRYVGEHNVNDAMRKLRAEAEAELSRELAAAALQKTATSTPNEIVRERGTGKSVKK